MVLVRPSTVIATLMFTFPARYELPLYGLQIVSRGRVQWTEKPAWFRNVPVTAVFPSPAQAEVRAAFGAAAKRAKELGYISRESERLKKWLPGAAPFIADHFVGYRATAERRRIARRCLHTMEELMRMYGVVPKGIEVKKTE